MQFLEKYRVFQTTDHDAGQDFASRVWEKHHSLLKGKQFDLTWNQADLKRASLAFVDHPCGVVATCDGPLSDTFRILLHQSGRMEHRINGKESVSFSGQCTIHPPQCNLRLDIEPFSLLLLSLDGKFVRSALTQRFSKLPPFEEWATSFSMSSPSIGTLNSLCLWMANELKNPQSPLHTQERAAASFERTLLTLFIEALVERHPSAEEIRGNLSELHVKRAGAAKGAATGAAVGAVRRCSSRLATPRVSSGRTISVTGTRCCRRLMGLMSSSATSTT
jgi:hypothetical protein